MDSSPILSIFTDDILAQILNTLSHHNDRKSFRLVCKSFLRVDSFHRRSIRLLRPDFLHTLVHNFPQIEYLDLSVCPPVNDGAMAALAGWGRGLRKLGLSRVTGLSPSGMVMLVRACPCLEVVDVSYCCGFGDVMAAALSCAGGLRELRMDKCSGVSDVGLANIAVGCQKLECLSLKWCSQITDLGIHLLSRKSKDLKLLDISYLKVTNESLRSIASMGKLNELGMVGLKLVNDAGLHYIGEGCPSLQAIDVSRCINVTSSGLISIIQGHNGLMKLNVGHNFFEISTTLLHWFKGLKNLQSIRIDGTRISNSSMKIISTNCRFLVEIGLSKCKSVADESILHLLSGCNNDLKILDLTCCTALTDIAIVAISESCRNLLCLKLESCNLITEKSLRFLGSHCSSLQELDLTDCSGVNDKGLNYLSKCSSLVCLKLGLCTNLSDKGLSYIASSCTKIHELDLYRCTGIGDDGIDALSSGCKSLKKLNISYCTEITDLGMKYLSRSEELKYLEMRELINITGVGLSSLACGCRKLAELDLKNCQNITDSGFWDLAIYSKNLRQINVYNCAICDLGLCMMLGKMKCLQDAKLLNLKNVSVCGFEVALRSASEKLKKVKLVSSLKFHLSPHLLHQLHSRGCKIKWG